MDSYLTRFPELALRSRGGGGSGVGTGGESRWCLCDLKPNLCLSLLAAALTFPPECCGVTASKPLEDLDCCGLVRLDCKLGLSELAGMLLLQTADGVQ